MKGTILDLGVIRAEDGKRYTFKAEDIENLNPNIGDFSGLEVDFEPLENTATSIFIISKATNAVAKSDSQSSPWLNLVKDVAMNFLNKNESNNNHESFCVELETNSQFFEVYVGNAVVASEFFSAKNITKVTQNLFTGNLKGTLHSAIKPSRVIRIADKSFNMKLNTVSSNNAMLGALLNSSGDIDDGDFIVLLAEPQLSKEKREELMKKGPLHPIQQSLFMPEAIAIRNLTKNTFFANTTNSVKGSMMKFVIPIFALLMIYISYLLVDNAPVFGFFSTWFTLYFLFGYKKYSKLYKDYADDLKRLMEYVRTIDEEKIKEAVAKNSVIVQ